MNGFISYNSYKKENALNETYESLTEILNLVNNLNNILKINNVYFLEKLINKNNNYPILKNFIDSKVGIVILPQERNPNVAGLFFKPNEYYKLAGDNIELLNTLKTKFLGGIIIILSPNKNVLVHEIQHAYDYYISKGKYINKKTHDVIRSTKDYKNSNKYYNMPHELNAYYTQVISEINFFEENKKIKDLKVLFKEFVDLYPEYERLTSKNKKILARKFSQYYYKIKEKSEQ